MRMTDLTIGVFALCWILPPFGLLGAPVPRPAAPADHGVQVTFSIQHPTATLHEPVYMLLKARNVLSRATTIYLGKDKTYGFEFTITDPEGARHPGLRLTEGGMGSIGAVRLDPGGKYEQNLVLNQWYPFDRIGTYEVRAKLLECLPTRPGVPVHVWSSPEMSLTIRPRSIARLEATCQKLLDTSLSSPDPEAASTAAVALSEVRDPVVLPYLSELLRAHTTLSGRAVGGLVRIGTPQAVRILTSSLGNAGPMLKAQIQSGLAEIRSGIHVTVAD